MTRAFKKAKIRWTDDLIIFAGTVYVSANIYVSAIVQITGNKRFLKILTQNLNTNKIYIKCLQKDVQFMRYYR